MEAANIKNEEQLLFFSKEELLNAFEDYKKDTCTGWRCVFKDPNFGKCDLIIKNS